MTNSYTAKRDAETLGTANFPTVGFLRLNQILAPEGPLPISKSGFWAGVKTGKFPRPRKISARVTVWLAADINELLAKIEQNL